MSAGDSTNDQFQDVLIQDHISMRDLLLFRTGGVADYFTIARKPNDIVLAVEEAIKLNVPYRVIGQGSTVLFSDSGFPGLIIQNQTRGMVFIHERSQVIVDSGVALEVLVTRSASLGYSGLEFLQGCPGTVGGAVVSNKGEKEKRIGQYVRSATILSGEQTSPVSSRRVSREWFNFSPIGSLLKERSRNGQIKSIPIILSITLQLSRMSHATCLQKMRESASRKDNSFASSRTHLQAFTNLSKQRNGSFTDNKKQIPPTFPVTRQQTKDWRIGAIAVVPENPNYIMNTHNGLSRDAAKLIGLIKKDIERAEGTPHCPLDFIGLWEPDEIP